MAGLKEPGLSSSIERPVLVSFLFKTSRTKILQTLAIRLSRCERLGRSPLKSRRVEVF